MIMKFYKLIPFVVFLSIVLAPQVSAFKQEDLDKLMSTKRCPKCDLSEADLSEANLSKANLKGADLKGSNLSKANLTITVLMHFVRRMMIKGQARVQGLKLIKLF